MTHPTENSLDVVAGLLLERQRYEGWLASLEAKKGATPPHVFERVRADYESRLRSVVDQLVSRAADLDGAVAALRVRVVELKRQADARRDERNEAELRATVGEYGPEEWTSIAAAADSEIARLEDMRSEVSGELERLEHILAMAAGRRATGGPSAAPGATEAPARTRAPSGDGTGEGFDELAFLNSVIAPGGSEAAPPASAAPASPPPATPAARGTPAEPERAVPPRVPTPAAPAPAVAPPPAPAPAPEPEPAAARGAQEESKVSRESGGVPAFLRDVPQENVKTLQCAECHAMNYPTEWYCERCGAELAAM